MEGIDLDANETLWCNPLHIAFSKRQSNMIIWLLDKELLLNTKNRQGETSLHIAYFESSLKAVSELLMTDGIDIGLGPGHMLNSFDGDRGPRPASPVRVSVDVRRVTLYV
jgi:ankyrin repeat protein